MKYYLILFLALVTVFVSQAQPCTNAGQTPATAFPVCGTSVFQQTTVPICGSQPLLVPGCNQNGGPNYADKNPYWYRFTCYQSGSLAFLIKPNNAGDDYDWQLYDITNKNPNDVFTDISLVVTGNWAGTYGNTGASASGVNFIQCASDPADNKNSFAAMPQLIAGHTYLLLVSHYTDSQSGYSLSFGGGTAVITDPTLPGLLYADAACDGDRVRVKLKKKIKCNSLTPTGSEFFVTTTGAVVSSATGIGCSTGFDTDSIELQLNAPLGPGTYTLNIRPGTDNNTLLDNCDNAISATEKINFTVYPQVPTPMDSLVAVKCAPSSLKLVFKKPMLCSSVAADGSDFSVVGNYPVTITGASGNCAPGTSASREITINLAQPLYNAGNFTIVLKTGTDGNTILNECNKETAAGSSLSFQVKDTVNAAFSAIKRYGCVKDTIFFQHPGLNGVNTWQWNLDDNQVSTQQAPTGYYSVFDQKQVSLIVSNGFCSDTATQSILLDNFLKAGLSVPEDLCPAEAVTFTSASQGIITQYQWSFGDGGSASTKDPGHTYQQPNIVTPYIVKLTVTDSIGCQSTAQKTVRVYSSCYIAVPNAFTPNNDGKNDALRVLNAIKAEKLSFRVFNRWGGLVFETQDWKQGWNGTMKGIPQGSGTYVWFLSFTDRDTKEARFMKGTATLIR